MNSSRRNNDWSTKSSASCPSIWSLAYPIAEGRVRQIWGRDLEIDLQRPLDYYCADSPITATRVWPSLETAYSASDKPASTSKSAASPATSTVPDCVINCPVKEYKPSGLAVDVTKPMSVEPLPVASVLG